MKTVFTTGEAAKICKVSQQTIIRCFDSGQLKGFRVPGSRFRRIPRDALYRFMKENGIPTDALESGKRRVLIVDDDQAVVDLISEVLAGDARFETRVVNNGFGAGMLAKEYHPDLIILDVMLPDINGQAVCELIRRDPTMADIKIICISGMVEEDKIQELRESGADDFLHKPLDIDELMRRVCRLLDMEAEGRRSRLSPRPARRRLRRTLSPDAGGKESQRVASPQHAGDLLRNCGAGSCGSTGLPLRPVTARIVHRLAARRTRRRRPGRSSRYPSRTPRWELDPGWVLADAGNRPVADRLSLIAERPWWPPGVSSGPVSELLTDLWRHSVAVGIVARRLAREAGDPDPEAVARAGRLCGLGCWAVAAVDPEWLVSWWRQDDPGLRERMERADLGSDLGDLGRRLAERWGCDPLVVDAAWLHADRRRPPESRRRRRRIGWRSSRRPIDGPNRPPGRCAAPSASRCPTSPGCGS